MRRLVTPELRIDLEGLVQQALEKDRIINIPVIAEKLRRKHEHLNIALEDFEELVLQSASMSAFPIEFDSQGGRSTEEHNELMNS